jgi:hypothetical protein
LHDWLKASVAVIHGSFEVWWIAIGRTGVDGYAMGRRELIGSPAAY